MYFPVSPYMQNALSFRAGHWIIYPCLRRSGGRDAFYYSPTTGRESVMPMM